MKFLMFKGIEGFGDRLQCLLQSITYCNNTNRILVVDWRDPDWYHGPINSYENYFNMLDIECWTLQEFENYYNEQKTDMSVAPGAWKDKLFKPNYNTLAYKKRFHFSDGQNVLFNINSSEEDFDEDIVVYVGAGQRSWRYNCSKQIQLTTDTYNSLNLPDTDEYNVLHIRGGSKPWNGGRWGAYDKDKILSKYPNMRSYITYLQYGIYRVDPEVETQLYICSDDHKLTQEMIKTLECHTMKVRPIALDTYNKQTGASGIHKIAKADITPEIKHHMNLEMLRDYYMMSNAKYLITDGMSLFSKMSRKAPLATN